MRWCSLRYLFKSLLELWVSITQYINIFNWLQLTCAFWLKTAELDLLHAFWYFWLFQQTRLICPPHWTDTCRSGRGNLAMTGILSTTHGAKTADTNYQVHLELLYMLCMCQILSWEKIWVWFVAVTAHSLFILSHSQISHHPNPQTGKLEYCLGLLRSLMLGVRKCTFHTFYAFCFLKLKWPKIKSGINLERYEVFNLLVLWIKVIFFYWFLFFLLFSHFNKFPCETLYKINTEKTELQSFTSVNVI